VEVRCPRELMLEKIEIAMKMEKERAEENDS
jgi:hypothetical protein